MRLPGKLGALREREFRLLYLAQTVSLLGDGMVPVAISFAVLDLTGSVSDLGYVLAASTLPLVVFLLVGGVVADRFSRRRVMMASDLVRFGSEGLIAALLISGHARLWHLAVLGAVRGGASAFFNPAATGLVPQTVSAVRLQEANALRGLAQSAGSIVGPAIAGVLVATAGSGWAIAANAMSFAVSAAFLARLRAGDAPAPARTSLLGDLGEGWREFRSRTWLWVIVLQFALFHLLVLAPFLALGALVSKESLGGAGAWSLILSASGVGALAGGVVALHARPRRPLLVATLGTFCFGPQIALLALREPAAAIAAAALVAGVGLALFGTLWDTTLQQQVPAEALSRVSAYDWLGSIAFLPLGFALVGPVSAALGTTDTLWLAFGALVATSAGALATHDVRRLRSGPAADLAALAEA